MQKLKMRQRWQCRINTRATKTLKWREFHAFENENLEDALGATITKNDIEAFHRVSVRNSESVKDIAVAVARRTKCDEVIAKACRTRLTTQDIGFTNIKSMFVNEHLCPQLKKNLGITVAKNKVMNGALLGWRMEGCLHGKQRPVTLSVYWVRRTSSRSVRKDAWAVWLAYTSFECVATTYHCMP